MDPKTQALKDKFKTKLKNTMSIVRGVMSPAGGAIETARAGYNAMKGEIEKRKTLPPAVSNTPTAGTNTSNMGTQTQTYVPTNVSKSNEPGSMSGYLRPTQTPQTPSYYADKMEGLAQLTPEEKTYLAQKRELDYKKKLGEGDIYAEMDMRTQPVDLTTPDLVGRLPGTQGLFNQQLNRADLYASIPAQVAGEARKTAMEGYNNLLTASMPQGYAPTTTPYSPLTGQYGGMPGGSGGAFSAGQIQGNIALGEQYAGMNAAHQAAQGIENSIVQHLQQNPNLNLSPFTKVNSALQFLNGQVGDPRYQTLSNYITEYIQTLTPILGVGGTAGTDFKTRIAQSMVNTAAQGGNIVDVLKDIDALAQVKLDQMKNAGMGGSYTQSGTTTGGGSIYSF